jgi:hypothetical protein
MAFDPSKAIERSSIDAGPAQQPLVVAFCDCSYLPLLQLWVRRVGMLGIGRLKIFCLDAATGDWCGSHGIDATGLAWSGDLRDLWVQRIMVFSELLAAGQEFIHSDIDAIWVRNPLTAGSAGLSSEDLVFSQGTVWPPDVHDQWGFVLCCGWFWARPSLATRSFFQALQTDVQRTGDDQVSVNRLLAAAQPRWSEGAAGHYQLAFRDRSVQCWTHLIRAVAGPLSIALLPQREFQRLPEDSAHAVVKHYLTPKNCPQKLSALRALRVI